MMLPLSALASTLLLSSAAVAADAPTLLSPGGLQY